MSSPDPKRPPAPAPFAWPPAIAASEPTPTVAAADASWSRPAGTASRGPAGTAAPDAEAAGAAFTDRPEVQVGAAFVGGFFAALILKRVGR